jgi:hypothetical protein
MRFGMGRKPVSEIAANDLRRKRMRLRVSPAPAMSSTLRQSCKISKRSHIRDGVVSYESAIWLRTLSRSSGSAINSGVSPTRLKKRRHGHAGAFEARDRQAGKAPLRHRRGVLDSVHPMVGLAPEAMSGGLVLIAGMSQARGI